MSGAIAIVPVLLSWLAANAPVDVPGAELPVHTAAEPNPAPAELPRGRSLAVDMTASRDAMLAEPVRPHASRAEQRPALTTRTQTPPAARANIRLSSRYGLRRDPLHGQHRMHHGIDIPGARGTQVNASAAGRVRFAGTAGGYGRMVDIEHGDGVTTRYGHLDRILVQPGMVVSQGETIGLMGATGRATGNHLHFEIRRDGRSVDPLPFLTGAQTGFAAGATLPTQPDDRPLASPAATHVSAFARARNGEAEAAGLDTARAF
ncbi:peptidoglycan DD-metalloendopeptidase family protein [Altererythrobacter xixiisoli]|uniref:Peptidoglycan DD-metalloendopeptidase family protein n=1 Tax=Croceibacterium xixiisoli TaxID=1476466 RepID=A0A6I4TVC7_9SPHN|nr:M23 family metallopeptidase [Croceibacterium xixiisoli]MXO98548.1 peptidoglycan DD-metalloendopeptidase family protein [Croceibacterium xixiisoli]